MARWIDPARDATEMNPNLSTIPMQTFSFDTVDSTNDTAKRLISEGRINGDACILAREQTAGRGTHGRSWLSHRDAGIYLSIVRLDAGSVTIDTTLHTLAAGVGCAEALAAVAGIDVRLKPINDLIADGGKLGGILTEARVEDAKLTALITGIGINVREADRRLPTDAMPAVALESLMPSQRFLALDVSALTNAIVKSVQNWQCLVVGGQSESVRRAWDSLRADR